MENSLLKAYDALVHRLNVDETMGAVTGEGFFSEYLRKQFLLQLQAFEAREPELINSESPTQDSAIDSFILMEGKQPLAMMMPNHRTVREPDDLQRFLNHTDEHLYTVQPTYKSRWVELVYTHGVLFRVMLRATAHVGRDIYDHAIKVKGIPTKAPLQNDVSSFHGEITISKANLKAYGKTPDPLTAVDQILKSGEGLEYLEFILVDVPNSSCRLFDTDDDNYTRLRRARAMHIGSQPPTKPVSYEAVAQAICDITATSEESQFFIRGVLVVMNDIFNRAGVGVSGWGVFWPSQSESIKVVVTDIFFSSRAHGDVFPVICFDLTEVNNRYFSTMVLKNLRALEESGIWIGDTIEINFPLDHPEFVSVDLDARPVDATPAVLPTKCSCGQTLTTVPPRHDILRCDNYHGCHAQILTRLKRYLSADGVDIKISTRVLNKLISTGVVTSIPDLYKLNVSDLTKVLVKGTAAERIVEGLTWALVSIAPSRHLAHMGIPNLSPKAAVLLANETYIDSIATMALSDVYRPILENLVGPAPTKALNKFCSEEHGAALMATMGHLLRG